MSLKKTTTVWTFFGLLLLSLTISKTAQAHPAKWEMEARAVVAEWATAVQGEDREALKLILSEEYGGSGIHYAEGSNLAREAYLASIGQYPVTKAAVQHAKYTISKDGIVATPVVIYPLRQFHTPFPMTLTLKPENGVLKIVSIGPGEQLPPSVLNTRHPKTVDRRHVPVSLRDKTTGKPVRARVHIRGEDGEYWPPLFHVKNIPVGWREDVGGDVVIDGKSFAYVTPNFTAAVPDGNFTMEIKRGLEYIPKTVNFSVKDGKVPELTVDLERWTHMKESGWYSGDTHVHFLDPYTALVEAEAEDLNVINILGSSGGDLTTSVHHFTGAPAVVSTDENIVYITEETRHDYLGHTVLLNLKELIYPMGWGEPRTGVIGGIDYPAMAHQADKANEQGALVAWAHFPEPHGELAIDMALGKIGAAEVFVFGNPMNETTRNGPFRTWYRVMNSGIDLPGLGATDKMWNTQIAGGVRTYVKIDGDFTYDAWVEGVRKGRTFVTSGPMLSLSAGGKGIGDRIELDNASSVPFEAEVHSRIPIKKLEIIVNGEVVAAKESGAGKTRMKITGDIKVEKSSWIAARAYTDQKTLIQDEIYPSKAPVLAHTSAIYIDVAGKPRTSPEDAAFLLKWCDEAIAWAKTKANYVNDDQRNEVVAIFEKAREFYAAQVE